MVERISEYGQEGARHLPHKSHTLAATAPFPDPSPLRRNLRGGKANGDLLLGGMGFSAEALT